MSSPPPKKKTNKQTKKQTNKTKHHPYFQVLSSTFKWINWVCTSKYVEFGSEMPELMLVTWLLWSILSCLHQLRHIATARWNNTCRIFFLKCRCILCTNICSHIETVFFFHVCTVYIQLITRACTCNYDQGRCKDRKRVTFI